MVYEPWQIFFYLGAALLVGVVVSVFTGRRDAASMDRFHALIRTPIRPGERLTESCSLPEGVNPASRSSFCAGTDFEFPKPSTISIVGFVLCWMAVAGMIGAFLWLLG